MVALMAGDLTEASRLAGEDLARFCSVPSLRAAARSLDEWMAESFTEIVMLRHAERAPLSTRVAGRAPGRSHRVRALRTTQCAAPLQPG